MLRVCSVSVRIAHAEEMYGSNNKDDTHPVIGRRLPRFDPSFVLYNQDEGVIDGPSVIVQLNSLHRVWMSTGQN